MIKNNLLPLLTITMMSMLVTSCAPTIVMYETTYTGENLTALTKITESSDAVSPFGGDDNGPLFFAYQADGKGQCNIYKKDNPLASSMTQVTSVEVAWFPTYNSAIDKIAFSMDNDIYTMPATKGKALTQITSTSDCKENHPCFSKDGKYLVYDRIQKSLYQSNYYYNTSNSEIWVRNLQTGENTLLGKGWSPSFSPDGQKICFCKVDNSEASIWIMDIDGENQTKITDNKTLESAQRPRFSPDGKYIVFDASDKSDNMDIYIISTDGNDLTRITLNQSSDTQPYWSTDGYIYFVSDRGNQKGNYNIWRFKIANDNTSPTYSPEEVKATTTSQPSPISYHEVQDGETISQIADKYGITISDIVNWNDLKSTTLNKGQKLKVKQ